MEIDTKLLEKLAELKKQLEDVSGQKIDASPEQLISLFFRVSLSSSEDGVIMSRSFIFPGKSCSQASALPANLFDVSSRSSTGSDGKAVFLLSDFICSKRPFKRDLEPERPAEVPGCPDFLVGHARTEWDRIAPGLHQLRLLSQLDVHPLATYCMSRLIETPGAADSLNTGALSRHVTAPRC
jgi:Phage terminase, small subunit